MKIFSLVTGFLFLLLPAGLWADRLAESSTGKTPEAGDLVLFPLDDVSIPWRDNLKLTMSHPKKFPGNPVLRAGPSEGPDGDGALAYGTVIKQDGKFRLWYIATPRSDSRIPGDADRPAMGSQSPRPIAYAESSDGIHWIRPNLGLVEFRGNKHNNLVAVEPAASTYARAHDFVAVLFDSADPDSEARYKMAYIAYDQPSGSWPSTATAVSPDGLRWRLVNTVAFTKGHFENSSLIRFDGLYYAAGQAITALPTARTSDLPAGRSMMVFFSPDFRHWSNGRALGFYRADNQPAAVNSGQEVHMGAGLWNRGNVILGLYGRWHGDTIHQDPLYPRNPLRGLHIDLGFVVSNDAIHYREPVRNFVVVPHGAGPDWDSEATLQSNAFANTATETYIWYSAWDTSQSDAVPPLPAPLTPRMIQKAYGVGLMTLPRDRFASFSRLLPISRERNPEYDVVREASCLTRSINLQQASSLSVNLDEVSPEAPLQIALVDDAERPLPGYSAELVAPSLKGPVHWDGARATLPVGRPFRVKLTWPVKTSAAKLYAIYIEHD